MSFFNAKECTDTLQNMAPFPAGEYVTCVTDATVEVNQEGYEFIKVVFEVVDGPLKNRKYFENLFLQSEFENLQSKSRAKLKLMCDIVGLEVLEGPSDLANFIGQEFVLDIALYNKKNNDGGTTPRNIINDIIAPPTKPVDLPIEKPAAKTVAKPVARPVNRNNLLG